MKTDLQTKMQGFMKEYLKYNTQVNNLKNYYYIKQRNMLDFKRILILEKIESLAAKRAGALRKWVQFIKEHL